MPALLPNTTTTDNYRDCELGGDRGYAYGSLTVANNPVSILLKHGGRGAFSETEYEFVTPSTLPLVGIIGRDEIVGVQLKSAIPGGGSPAQVSGWLVEPNVAGLQPGSAYTSTVSAGGGVTPPGAGGMIGITGRVSAAGVILAGTGYTAVRLGVGSYRLTWDTPFATAPVVLAQVIVVGGANFHCNLQIASATLAEIVTGSSIGAGVDQIFDFIAVEMV